MKVCTKCGQSKVESEFFVRDKKIGKLHAQCKACYQTYRATYHKTHYAAYRDKYLQRAKTRNKKLRTEHQIKILSYLSGKACIDCDEDDLRVLEFDHIDSKEKLFTISQAVKLGYGWDAVALEIKKCRVLCANCHKKRTAKQFNWYKDL